MDVKKVKSVSTSLIIKKPISKSILKRIIRLLHLILDISCKSWNSNIFKCPNTFGVPVDIDGITSEYKSYICCCFLRLREDQDLKQTGMAILDVGLLTGFSLAQNGVELNDLVRRVETPSGRVTLYLDTVSSSFIFMTTIIQYTCAKSAFVLLMVYLVHVFVCIMNSWLTVCPISSSSLGDHNGKVHWNIHHPGL